MDNYDINRYSDDELYSLLDLINPSDRVLEAKIIQMINKYSNIPNTSGEKLFHFFQSVYDRFFGSEEDEDAEEDDDPEDTNADPNIPTSVATTATASPNPPTSTSPSKYYEGFELLSNQASGDVKAQNVQNTAALDKNVIITETVNYTRDQLNPILKQTTRRIISIDSQYRDDKSSLSTNFTFNLSQPLKDVVALKLYSIQIPNTWYTINNNYGGNFFYLKGTSDGINDGTFDYQIAIPSGNYTPADLITAINTSIASLAATNTNMSFGNTKLTYNASTSIATATIDISHLFNETNFQLYFPEWTSPNTIDTYGNELRYTSSIAAFLGFNYPTYIPNSIYSSRNLPLSTYGSFDDAYASIYAVDASNNYFYIVQYQGPSEYTSDASMNTIKITLNLNGKYSRNSIVSELNTQLAASPYLVNSSVQRIDITNPDILNNQSSYFALTINLNKYTTKNISSLKTAILFPSETTNTNSTIWVPNAQNAPCCFNFQSHICELNNITAETNSLQTNYIINTSPHMILKCITPGYTDPSYNGMINTQYMSYNDFKVNVPNSTTIGGYSLSQYISAVNTAIDTTNSHTTNSENPSGIINLTYTGLTVNSNSICEINFDINKTFTKKHYTMDLSSTMLYKVLHLGNIAYDPNGTIDGNNIDLSTNYVFTSTIISRPTYVIDTSYIAIINPKSGFEGEFASPWLVPPVPELKTGKTLTNFVNYMNASLKQFQDTPGSFPLMNSWFSMTSNINNTVIVTLTIAINKTLTQNDYQVLFYDTIGSTPNVWNPSTSTWVNNFKFTDASYNIASLPSNPPYNYLLGGTPISGNEFTGNIPQTIIIRGVGHGVSTTAGTNDITINIPAAPSYTRQVIFNLINSALASYTDTNGYSIATNSVIEIKTNTSNLEFVNLRLNINKVFYAQDYSVVFYDLYSFVKCNLGIGSVRNATWDSTLGWILGFRANTEYPLSSYISSTTAMPAITITGDTTVSIQLYNYFLLVIDDFTQSHINDGLVTLTQQDTSIPLPSYASRADQQCYPPNNDMVISGTNQDANKNGLTQAQIYAANQILQNKKNTSNKKYSSGPYVQDVFGMIPLKIAGLPNGSSYVDYGGTLQDQNRMYFGPVNIHRMNIQLVTDRGDNVDLNGSNWSFSLVCEQLYQQKSL